MKKRKHSKYYQALKDVKQLRNECDYLKDDYYSLDIKYNTLAGKYELMRAQFEEALAQNNILRLQIINMKGEPNV